MQDERDTTRAGSGEGTPANGPEWIYGALSDIPKIIAESLQHLQKIATEDGDASPEGFQATISGIAATIAETLQRIITENAIFSENEKAIAAFTDCQLESVPEDLQSIAPYLQDELRSDPEHAGTPIEEVLKAGIDESGNLTDSPYRDFIARAQQRARIDTALHTAVDALQVLERTGRNIASIKPSPEGQDAPEPLTASIPRKYVIPNNKLANVITRLSKDLDTTLNVEGKNARKKIVTTVLLSFDRDNIKLSGRWPVTEYDRSVQNAVASLWVYGDQSHTYTPQQIYRAMVNADDTENPSPQQIAAVINSMDKARFTRVRIDCTEELKTRGIRLNSKQINKGQIDTYLLAADKITVQAGGREVTAYKVMRTPILYEYAAAVKQVITLPASYLDIKTVDPVTGLPTSHSIPSTEQRIAIRDYLLRRIEGMKKENGLNQNTVLLEDYTRDDIPHLGLYSIAGKPNPARAEAKRIRDDAEKMLDFWQAIRHIKGYEVVTGVKNKRTGYRIIV